MDPLVSVITPTFNAAEFLEETVASVLAQTYERVEHVLVDDGSTDDSPALLRKLAAQNPDRVRVVIRNGRAGPCRRRNDALVAARGELVAWLDHDDLFAPDKLARQVEALESSDEAVFTFAQYEEFDDATGETIARSHLHDGDDLLRRLFVEGCFVASSSVMFRRSRRARKLRDVHFSFGDDYYLWLTLLLDGPAVLVDAPLVRLRRHTRNESARLAATNYHRLRLALLRDYLDEFPEASDRLGDDVAAGLSHHAVAAASWELEHGRRLGAARYALRAASYDPGGAARYVRRIAGRAPRRLLPHRLR
jgi:teichuronic acid biosynthesis glycosyltransferase TuaG